MLEIIYITLGLVLIASAIVITFVVVRFFESYRNTLKHADITIRVAESSFQELDSMVTLVTNKFSEAEQFFAQLSKTGEHLEFVNTKFDDILKVAEKYPTGLFTSIFMLKKIDIVKELPRVFNILNYDEELNSMLKDFIKGAIIGGLAVAFLTPKTGEEMRKVAMQKLDELKDKAQNINAEEVRDGIFKKIEELKTYITTSSKDEILNRIFDEIKNLYEKVKGYLSFKAENTTERLEKQ